MEEQQETMKMSRDLIDSGRAFGALTFLLLLGSNVRADVAVPPEKLASRAAEKGCAWTMTSSLAGEYSALTQVCDYGFRKITFQFKGDVLYQNYSDSSSGDKVIEFFKKSKNQTPQEVLKELFISKLSDYERQHCIVRHADPKTEMERSLVAAGKTAWEIAPDKKYAAKIRKKTPKGEIPEPSCGDYGAPEDSRAYFEFHSFSPNSFAWVVIGQDTPLFDEQSVVFP